MHGWYFAAGKSDGPVSGQDPIAEPGEWLLCEVL